MNVQGLVLVVAVGAAAIAVWLDVRLDRRTPRTVTWTFVHIAFAILALQTMPRLIVFVAGSESPGRKVAAVLAVLLPILTYSWLATIWLLKLVQRAAHLRR